MYQVAAGRGRLQSRALAAAGGLALVLTACTSDDAETGATGGGDSVLVAAVDNLGTHQWAPALTGHDNEKISMFMFDTLTQLNRETLELEPALAESWEVSPDGTTWTFTLRPDVPFHDDWGTMTTEDVKFSWEQWISPDSTHNYGPQMAEAIDNDMTNFEIVSDLEFRLHTTTPVMHLPSILCSCDSGLQITSRRYFDETPLDEANAHPIGTGPWKFVSSTPGEEVVLEAVEDHWLQAPSFDRLILKEIPNSAARLVQVQSGDVDIAALDAGLTNEALAAELDIRTIPDIGNLFVILGGMYPGHPNYDTDAPWIQADNPAAGLAVREAMSLAIDRQLIIDQLLHGEATPAYGPLYQYNANPSLVDPSWELPEYNLEEARQKLTEGGYPDGFEITLFQYTDDVDTVSIGEGIAGMWEELGLTVTRQPGEEDVLDERLNSTDTGGLAWVKIAGFRSEPAPVFDSYTSSREDDHKFFHLAIDEAYPQLRSEPDQETRFAIARNAISQLRDDYTVITLFTANMPFVTGPDVGGWDPIPGLNALNSLESVTPS